MAENTTYLKEMLEVPMVDGHSEDVCGQDDNFYAFGFWTDFCGLSDEELKKAAIANAAGSSECCGGGGGGGDSSAVTDNTVTLTLEKVDDGFELKASAKYSTDTDVTITAPIIIHYPDGTTGSSEVTLDLPSGSKTGKTIIEVETGSGIKVLDDITVEPEESEKYRFIIDNQTDVEINSIIYGTVLFNDMEEYGIDCLTESLVNSFGEVMLTKKETDISSTRDAEVDPAYRGQSSIARNHAYDFLFLLDSDVFPEDLIIQDMTTLDSAVIDLGESLGIIGHAGENYSVYRLSNPDGWSVVVAPGEPEEGYEWKYKIIYKKK
jgi:hypothetical protein